jgi:hypothetical protein
MLPQIIYPDEHHTSGKDTPSIASLLIDAASETVLGELPSEEGGDATKDFLDASRILRAYVHHQWAWALTGVHLISNRRHPGLVMEHYDPDTSVHTFKIACPRRQQDEYPRLPSPSTPSLSNSSR